MTKKTKAVSGQIDLFGAVIGKPTEALTVSAFLDHINELVGVQPAVVQGEVTGWRPHPSGVYFSLKDREDGAMLDCYLNPYLFRGLGVMVEDGMEVRVTGTPSIYKPKGRFSFRVEKLELAGEGSLKKAYELLKKQLEVEGLFARKRPLLEFIGSVGIVTSRTGAVIDDFRKNIAKLGLKLYLKDVRVEGAQAVGQILAAIQLFNDPKSPEIDVLVVMRGGGSLEDLQPFNNELVARALFSCRMPTIVAIGHDRDVPIAQMVADVAPSTPTAAAVAINNTWLRLTQELPSYIQQMIHMFQRGLDQYRTVANLDSLVPLFQNSLAMYSQKISGYESYLSAVSPERNLKLGYSIATDEKGKVIKSASQVTVGQHINVRLNQGKVGTRVESRE